MRERPVRFGQDAFLFGVVCDPGPVAAERPAFLFLNAGLLNRVGPSRLHVQLGRALAEKGFLSLRFDFSGIGDSELPRDGRPFGERAVVEVREAMDHLEETRGLDRFVLVGLCSGADAAHDAAVRDPRVAGLVPMDGHLYPTWRYYVHRYGPRLLRMRSWLNLVTGRTYVAPFLRRALSPHADEAEASVNAAIFRRHRPPKARVERELQALADRGVRIFPIFTGDLEMLCAYDRQFQDAFRRVDFRGGLEVAYLEDSNHTFTPLAAQREVLRRVTGWAIDGWGAATPPEPGKKSGNGRGDPTTVRAQSAIA